jgi:hypothetical protein
MTIRIDDSEDGYAASPIFIRSTNKTNKQSSTGYVFVELRLSLAIAKKEIYNNFSFNKERSVKPYLLRLIHKDEQIILQLHGHNDV